MSAKRDRLDVDVLIVGAGPAGLSCAIHLARLLKARGKSPEECSIAIIEKAAEVGQHILSGAVMDPKGIDELFQGRWKEEGCPVEAPVKSDAVYFLTAAGKIRFPVVPPTLRNHGGWVVSLSRVAQWLKGKAEELGVTICEGFPGCELILEGEKVAGAITADKGIDRQGRPKASFAPGTEICAKVTVLCEGSRGSLTKQLVERLNLHGPNPQIYGTGVKEVWELPEGRIEPGEVIHTAGWPLRSSHYGGGWIYGMPGGRVSIGFVSALDYRDPRFDPFEAMQRWKTHPLLRSLLAGGKLLLAGAKTVPEGGYWSQPRLYGDGFLIAGDGASFLNALRLKGIHTAIKSGMLAAEAIDQAIARNRFDREMLSEYDRLYRRSWAEEELRRMRNLRQAFQSGFFLGMARAGLMLALGGKILADRVPARPDAEHLMKTSKLGASPAADGASFRPDGVLTIDKLAGVYHAGSIHEEDQPSHLVVSDLTICATRCREEYGNPCERFCPAKVYEMVEAPENPAARKLHINHSNCVHCKTCDIMDPYGIITWTVPADAGGPKYMGM